MRTTMPAMIAGLLLGTALGLPSTASAQQQGTDNPNPNIPVQNRARPDYDALGIRARSFLFYPSLTLGMQYNDNVNADKNNTDSAFIGVVAPNMNIESDWSRHSLNFDIGSESGFYSDYDSNNYTDFHFDSNGTLEITRDNILSGLFNIKRLHDDRSSPDVNNTDQAENRKSLPRYWLINPELRYQHNFNRLFTVIGAGYRRYDFDGPSSENVNERDRNEYGPLARVGYTISPRINVFGQGTYTWREYDTKQQPQDVYKNSHGYQVTLGSQVDITGLIFGEIGVSYNNRQFDNNDFRDVSGWGGNGKLTWNVTPLTTIIGELRSNILETTVTYDGDTADSDFQNSFSLDVTHELLRNLLLNANGAYIRDDFQGTSRTDNVFEVGGGVTYLINRNFSVDATYTYEDRQSDDSEAEYSRNIFMISLTSKL
ncbi:MAG: outer membrane beta-barrel protein [Geminicoccaceae bacterium]